MGNYEDVEGTVAWDAAEDKYNQDLGELTFLLERRQERAERREQKKLLKQKQQQRKNRKGGRK